jgi:hypothetical protein
MTHLTTRTPALCLTCCYCRVVDITSIERKVIKVRCKCDKKQIANENVTYCAYHEINNTKTPRIHK